MAIRTMGQKAAARLIDLTKALRRVASGATIEAANKEAARQIYGYGAAKLRQHTKTGEALATWKVDVEGDALVITKKSYLRHKWFPFRSSRLPMGTLKTIAAMYVAAFRAEIGGEVSDAAIFKRFNIRNAEDY